MEEETRARVLDAIDASGVRHPQDCVSTGRCFVSVGDTQKDNVTIEGHETENTEGRSRSVALVEVVATEDDSTRSCGLGGVRELTH